MSRLEQDSFAIAEMIEDAADSVADRLLIRLGAWILTVFGLQVAVLIAVQR